MASDATATTGGDAWPQPRSCPVCSSALHVRTLGCERCGTEINGTFTPCALCSLPADERQLLEAFLESRGRVNALQQRLGVSYPTARTRLEAALDAMGVGAVAGSDPYRRALVQLAQGDIDVDEATRRLKGIRSELAD